MRVVVQRYELARNMRELFPRILATLAFAQHIAHLPVEHACYCLGYRAFSQCFMQQKPELLAVSRCEGKSDREHVKPFFLFGRGEDLYSGACLGSDVGRSLEQLLFGKNK